MRLSPGLSLRALPLALLVAACHTEAKPEVAVTPVQKPVPRVVVPPTVVVAYSTEELLAELERARSLLLVDRFVEASEALERIRTLATDPAIQASATFHAGLAKEGQGDRLGALERFRKVYEGFETQAVARVALVRATRLLGRLERWAELGEVVDRLMRRTDLPVLDQLEARGAKALALVEQGDAAGASIHVGKALEILEKTGFSEAIEPPIQAAQVAFARGEILRLRGEAVHLVPVTPDFSDRLEERCTRLIEAQHAYTEAMRSKDSYWSAMSGYRVGRLYTDLHAEAMSIPTPAKAVTLKQKQLFEGALRMRYRILLEKGLAMMSAIVRLGDRTGEQSEWVTRAREAKRSIENALAEEKRALALLPYTEAELKQGLEDLKARVAERSRANDAAGDKAAPPTKDAGGPGGRKGAAGDKPAPTPKDADKPAGTNGAASPEGAAPTL